MALTWTLKLKDAMSAAADKAAAAMGRVRASLEGTKAAASKVDAALGRTGKTKPPASAWSKFGTTLKGVGSKAAAMAASVAAAALALAGAAAVKLGGGILEGALDASAIKRGLSLLLGGTAQAEAAWSRIAAKAADIGMGTVDAAKQVQALLASGFKLDGSTGALRVLEAAQALKVINPRANIDNVITALSQIQAKGKLTAEELHGQLGDAGVNIGAVYEALAKKLGTSTDEVRKLMQKGAISAKDGIEAVFESIEKQGGKSLSELAKANKGSFSNIIERLKTLPQEMGSRMDLAPFFEKAGPAIQKVIDTLTDPKVLAFFETLINKVGGGLFDGFGEGFAEAAKVMSDMDPGDMDALASAARALGKALGVVAAALLFASRSGAAMFDYFATLKQGFVEIGEFFSGLGESWFGDGASIGGSMVSGIAAGIKEQAQSVIDAIVGVATDAVASAKAVLGIHSPSSVMRREVAHQMMRGGELGVEDMGPRVVTATQRVFERARDAAAVVGGAVSNVSNFSRSTSSSSRSSRVGQIVLPPSAGLDEQGVARVVRSQLRQVLAQGG